MAVISSQCLYLKAIYTISKEKGTVRNKDIAQELSFSKPSVTLALSRLSNEGLVEIEKSGNIILTEKGMELAQQAIDRNNIVCSFFRKIGAEERTAKENSRMIDCQITDDLLDVMKQFITSKIAEE